MLIEVKDLKKYYEKFNLNCSLKLEEGMVTGIIGENGAGKSTTFKSILGLVETDGGFISILGKKPNELTEEDKQNIGVVLSDSGFSEYMSVGSINKVLKSIYKNHDEDSFISFMNKNGIPLNKKIKELSTGMKVKLKIATALTHDSKLLILDEPTAGLDVVARDDILDMLRTFMEKEDRSILISSHISSDIEGLCDDVYIIHNGEICFHDEIDNILSKYGIIKCSEEDFKNLDKDYIIRRKKESYGYSVLTNEKQYYIENYQKLVIDKCSLDDVTVMYIRGERV